MNYKVTLFRNNIYKEICLKEYDKNLMIGTQKECQIRFNRKNFFVNFTINVCKKNDGWYFTCCSDIYFSRKSGLKEYVYYPKLGEVVRVCLSKSDTEIFSMEYSYDFSNKHIVYNNEVDISQLNVIEIGGKTGADIYINDELLGKGFVRLRRIPNGYEIDSSSCDYKVYINGYSCDRDRICIPNRTFIALIGYNFFIDENVIIADENGNISTSLRYRKVINKTNSFSYPKYIKNARQHYVVPKEKINVRNPKEKEAEPKSNIIATLLPSLASMIAMTFLRGSSGGMMALYMPVVMGIGIFTSVFNHRSAKKEHRKKMGDRVDKYADYIEYQQDKIKQLEENEKSVLLLKYTSLQEKMKYVEDFSAKLFEKSKEDDDYLEICLGKGKIKSSIDIEYSESDFVETDDDLMDYPKLMHDKYQYIDNAPVTLKLREISSFGVVGSRFCLYQMAKNMLFCLVTEHFYNDVKVIFIMNDDDRKNFEWIRWVKNIWNNSIDRRGIIYNDDSSKVILEFLYSELNRRMEEKVNNNQNVIFETDYVVFVYRSDIIAGHPVVKYMKNARALGFNFIFFEEYEELLNTACEYKIYLKQDTNVGIIQDIADAQNKQKFEYDVVPDTCISRAFRKLAPVYIDEVSLESTLTKNISLFELLEIFGVEDLELGKRWATSKIYETMAAPLGVSSGNSVVYLDLHEKFHGPHGLVAGTTGSGKSEIIQSYILSMATLFHPYEVGFIIIDFKGGGMVNQFRDLPHLNGAITNIDGREIDRSLKSIKAELQKRQKYFAIVGVNHIDDYIREYKNGNAPAPLPHLILIVDEFAELKAEQPNFMKELISAARIGRSLGVHLILATQKPSGVVDAQIWSNSKFKLCLKVQDESDSREVLKSPLAAEIREPGRAYLQVGNNEIFKLFQSAYSGATVGLDNLGQQKKYKIYQVGFGGERRIIYEEKPKTKEEGSTQLDVLVEYIQKYCTNKGIKKLPDICLPSLSDKIDFTLENYNPETKDICVPIGILDDPSRQRQDVTDINITSNNIMIVGSSQSGKTNLLQSIIRGVTSRYSSSEVNIYILDFATMILKNMEGLKHIGGVVTSREDEKLKNFFKMIIAIMEYRKDVMSELGLSSFSTYREAGYNQMPQIIIMIDNIVALKELFPEVEEILMILLRDGLPLGIEIIAANSQSRGFGFKMQSNFSKKIALYCNDSGEYSSCFEKTRMTVGNIKGRCLIEEDREIYECQTYLSFTAQKEIDKLKEINAYIKECNKNNKVVAQRIPEIPNRVTNKYLEERFGDEVSGKDYILPVGLDFATTNIYSLNLLKDSLIGISSKPEFGKENFICNIIEKLNSISDTEPSEVYIIDDVERSLSRIKDLDIVKTYSINPDSVKDCLETVRDELESRYKRLAQGGENQVSDEKMIVLIFNSIECYDVIDEFAYDKFEDIVLKYLKQKVCMWITNLPNQALSYSSPAPIRVFRERGSVFVFEDAADIKICDVPFRYARENSKALQMGECFHINGSDISKIKTIQ